MIFPINIISKRNNAWFLYVIVQGLEAEHVLLICNWDASNLLLGRIFLRKILSIKIEAVKLI